MYSTSCSGLSARSSGHVLVADEAAQRVHVGVAADAQGQPDGRFAPAVLSSSWSPSANVVPLLWVGRPSETRMIAGG